MAKLDIDIDYIAKLAELLQRTGLTEIEIGEGDVKVRVAKQIHAAIDMTAAMAPGAMAAHHHHAGPPIGAEPAPSPDLSHPGLVTSPMVGTAYLSPPFVTVGQEVREGATLLIIEAMKVMNSIRAPRSGRVSRIFIENATPVEFGEPLLIIE